MTKSATFRLYSRFRRSGTGVWFSFTNATPPRLILVETVKEPLLVPVRSLESLFRHPSHLSVGHSKAIERYPLWKRSHLILPYRIYWRNEPRRHSVLQI